MALFLLTGFYQATKHHQSIGIKNIFFMQILAALWTFFL